jgi:hypothetical protein
LLTKYYECEWFVQRKTMKLYARIGRAWIWDDDYDDEEGDAK